MVIPIRTTLNIWCGFILPPMFLLVHFVFFVRHRKTTLHFFLLAEKTRQWPQKRIASLVIVFRLPHSLQSKRQRRGISVADSPGNCM